MVSVRYRLLNGPSVPLSALAPTLLLLNLNTGMDSGGALVVNLLLNKVSRLMGGGGVPWAGVVSPGQGLSVLLHALQVVGTTGTISLFCCYKILRAFFSCFQRVPPASSDPNATACGVWRR